MHIGHAFLLLFRKFLENVVTKYYKAMFHVIFLLLIHSCTFNMSTEFLWLIRNMCYDTYTDIGVITVSYNHCFVCLKSRVSRGQIRPETKGP